MNLGQILVKALLHAAVVGTLLPWFGGAPIVTSAAVGAVLGVISWIADVTVREWIGNVLGAVAEGGIAYLYLRMAPMFWPVLAVSFSALVIASLSVAIVEFFYHRMLPSPQRERV